MAQRAGRVGVNPVDVDPVTGHVNVEVPGNVYTKTQVDNKFLTKTKAASDYQAKALSVPIELLDGSALTVEAALQGLNSQKQDKQLVVPIQLLNGSVLTVEAALQALANNTKQGTVTSNYTLASGYNKVFRNNNIVSSLIRINNVTGGVTAYDTVLATIPEGFRPVDTLHFPVVYVEGGAPKIADFYISDAGAIKTSFNSSSELTSIQVCITWYTN